MTVCRGSAAEWPEAGNSGAPPCRADGAVQRRCGHGGQDDAGDFQHLDDDVQRGVGRVLDGTGDRRDDYDRQDNERGGQACLVGAGAREGQTDVGPRTGPELTPTPGTGYCPSASLPARCAVGEPNSRVVPEDVKFQVSVRDQRTCVQCRVSRRPALRAQDSWSRRTNTADDARWASAVHYRRRRCVTMIVSCLVADPELFAAVMVTR